MDKRVKSGGMGFVSVLVLIFIVLKLTGLIDWSWVWVLSPVWIPRVAFCPCICNYFDWRKAAERKMVTSNLLGSYP